MSFIVQCQMKILFSTVKKVIFSNQNINVEYARAGNLEFFFNIYISLNSEFHCTKCGRDSSNYFALIFKKMKVLIALRLCSCKIWSRCSVSCLGLSKIGSFATLPLGKCAPGLRFWGPWSNLKQAFKKAQYLNGGLELQKR